MKVIIAKTPFNVDGNFHGVSWDDVERCSSCDGRGFIVKMKGRHPQKYQCKYCRRRWQRARLVEKYGFLKKVEKEVTQLTPLTKLVEKTSIPFHALRYTLNYLLDREEIAAIQVGWEVWLCPIQMAPTILYEIKK